MQFAAPIPFEEAIDKIGTKTPIGSALNSAEWSDVPLALRERAFFSSRVESARFLQRAQNSVSDFLAGAREVLPNGEVALKTGSRQQFVKDMQEFAVANGMGSLPGSDDAGGLQDISSEKRLGLIFDTQTRQAQSFGDRKQGLDPDVLNEFPAQRFIREVHVHEPRDWHKFFEDGVWLKTDVAAWIRINQDFGVPWGPWGWGCGHGEEDVDRDEAEALGLIKPGEVLQGGDENFNDRLEASVRGLEPEVLDELRSAFGDQVEIEGDTVRWRPSGQAPSKKAPAPKPKPEKAPAPHPDPLPSGEGMPASTAEAAQVRLDATLATVRIKDKAIVTADDMSRLREELKETAPAQAKDVILTVRGKKVGALTEAGLQRELQEFLNYFPAMRVGKLPKLHLSAEAFDANGDYRFHGRVRVHSKLTDSPDEARRVMHHELMHWVHLEGPQWYRDLIAKHFAERTAGEKVQHLGTYSSDVRGKADKWYEVYAGRLYPGLPDGPEVPTRYIEWLTKSPEAMARMWNDPDFRETMLIVLRGLF